MQTESPIVSIVIPVYNEIDTIKDAFISICNSNYDRKEIFFVDGMSNDGTYEWLDQAVKDVPNCYLEKNEKRFVSYGFNQVFPKTVGKYVSRLDGHSKYPSDYFEIAVNILDRDEADVVGGPAKHVGKTWKGETIASCMMHPFGVGLSSFRTETRKKYVDTVPFPVYKRSVLENVGLYDEELVRNQDDELNYRCGAKGYRILMDPALGTKYFVRENLSDLWKQYFQYGLFKPLVFKKVPQGRRWHHFMPAVFSVFLPVLSGLGLLHWSFLLPVMTYFTLLVIISGFIQNSMCKKFYSILVFPCLHFGYGLGFISGQINLSIAPFLKRD